MHIKKVATALFLFAHQDDEFGVFQTIADCRAAGMRIACAYLTRHPDPAIDQRRNQESLGVLDSLGVPSSAVRFGGAELAIDDATLPLHMARAADWIDDWIGCHDNVDLICVTAWEGGHHDHDCLHAMTAHLAAAYGQLGLLRQYSLYNRLGCPGPLFNVLAPLAANGPVEWRVIPVRQRLRYLRLCLQYPSQRTTWIGLFPFVLLHYLMRGVQTLQPVTLARIADKPHAGVLYYEHRQFYTWDKMQQQVSAWRQGVLETSGTRGAQAAR